MIESISDAVQLFVLAVCFTLALVRAIRVRTTTWVTLTCFSACMFMGNAYWFGYLLVFGETPGFSYIADVTWVSGYAFLLMVVAETDRHRGVGAPVAAAWVPVALCCACGVFYIVQSGHILLNIVDNGLMAAMGFFAVRGICAQRNDVHGKEDGHVSLSYNAAFHGAVLAFVAVEQALWLSSCFLEPGPIVSMNPYIVVGFVLTVSYAALLASAWRSNSW